MENKVKKSASWLDLTMRVQYLRGVGPKRAEQLARLGVERVIDLMFLLPRRYLDATNPTPITEIEGPDREITVVGKVVSARLMYANRRKIGFEAVLDDGSGKIHCRWFGRAFLQGKVQKGQLWLVLVSQGLVGAIFFVTAIGGAAWRTRRGPTVPFWCHVTLVVALVQLPFYDMLPVSLHVIALCAAVALRRVDEPEPAPHEVRAVGAPA